MADRKYTHGLAISTTPIGVVLDIGDMEIWDGADLSLIRDTLFRLVLQEGVDSIAIDMHAVQYVPSGFFGMLFDWLERGVEVRLVNPRERVRQMLWFRKFFVQETTSSFRLHSGNRIDEHHSENLWDTRSEQHVPSSKPAVLSVVS
ncbi:STAS domain-containing protein [Planctomicrobium sp. SH661]|uniref:STAS domain-containing protein n=1 Tax=Planctomicrobium sp. SH661 TaxID=3448124 RepID=UPI003F5BC2CB